MHPLAKCCGMYCACLMVCGIVFFAILAVMEKNGNMFLTKAHPEETGDKITALLLTIGLNAICLVNCVACVVIGTRREAEEARKRAEQALKA